MPPARKLPRVLMESRVSARKEIAIQRENDFCCFEIVMSVYSLPERLLRRGPDVVAIYRLPRVPLCLRVQLLHVPYLRDQSRRRDCAGEDAHPSAPDRLLRIQRSADRSEELPPGSRV